MSYKNQIKKKKKKMIKIATNQIKLIKMKVIVKIIQ